MGLGKGAGERGSASEGFCVTVGAWAGTAHFASEQLVQRVQRVSTGEQGGHPWAFRRLRKGADNPANRLKIMDKTPCFTCARALFLLDYS